MNSYMENLAYVAAHGAEDDRQYLKMLRIYRRTEAYLSQGQLEPKDQLFLGLVNGMLKSGMSKYEWIKGDRFRKGTWNPTYSGRRYWILDPRADEVEAEDICHGLAGIARYNGATHGNVKYSVAQHCTIGSYFVEPEFALEFHLHDAPEPYVGDIVSPVKRLISNAFDPIEDATKGVIAEKFNLKWTPEAEIAVKQTDNDMLMTEVDQLLVYRVINEIPKNAKILPVILQPWPYEVAYAAYKRRLFELLALRASSGSKAE